VIPDDLDSDIRIRSVHTFGADVRGLGAGIADPVLDEDLRNPRLVYGNAVGR
jgi:hypothetical protein